MIEKRAGFASVKMPLVPGDEVIALKPHPTEQGVVATTKLGKCYLVVMGKRRGKVIEISPDYETERPN